MQLPHIQLPTIPLGFEIPSLLHPYIVHFAVAIPVMVLIAELINLLFRNRSIGALNFFWLSLSLVVAYAAFITGSKDSTAIEDTLLDQHMLNGVYVVYSLALVLVFKLISSVIRKPLLKIVYILLLALSLFFIYTQAYTGTKLVHGVVVSDSLDATNSAATPAPVSTPTPAATPAPASTPTPALPPKEPEAKKADIDSTKEALKSVATKSAELIKAANVAANETAQILNETKQEAKKLLEKALKAAH